MENLRLFPRTTVGGISLPRMIIGSNWLAGFSHTSPAADRQITERYSKKEDFLPVFEAYLSHGVDAFMACISQTPLLESAAKYAEDRLGKKIILIDTPFINVDDTPQARHEAELTVRHSAETGCTFCLMHHSRMEQLVNKNKGIIGRLPDYLKMKRDAGLIPGLSAHMPEAVLYCDNNGYDVETYIQIFNCMGFLMQIEIETVAKIINNARHPVMTIKPFAAGRCSPYVGLNFNWSVLRECDMITCGAYDAREALEDIEISFGAFDRRYPDIGGRSSPVKDQAVLAYGGGQPVKP